LVFAAQLAAQVDDFFRRGTDAFEGSRRGLAFQRLEDELANAVNEAALQVLHRDLQSFSGSSDAVVASAASLLIQRRRIRHPPRFAALMQAVFESLQAEAGGRADQALTPSELSAVVGRRQKRLELKLAGFVDRILARYCRHYLLRNPYTDAPSLLNYLGRMALSVASILLLLLGTPAVTSLLDADDDAQADEARLSAVAVDVIQIFTKAVSHQVDFLAAIQRAGEEGKGVTFGRLVLFAKFV
jgi:lysine-N-methylase